MPKSRTRKTSHYTAPTEKAGPPAANAVWFVPVMVGLLVVGLAWIVATYLFSFDYPIPGIRSWNLVIGFGFAIAGLGMATRWR